MCPRGFAISREKYSERHSYFSACDVKCHLLKTCCWKLHGFKKLHFLSVTFVMLCKWGQWEGQGQQETKWRIISFWACKVQVTSVLLGAHHHRGWVLTCSCLSACAQWTGGVEHGQYNSLMTYSCGEQIEHLIHWDFPFSALRRRTQGCKANTALRGK